MDATQMFNSATDWSGARCVDRPAEFCPGEDIMTTSEWTKGVAPERARECITCTRFEQCELSLLSQLADEEISPTGIMAGVVLVQKSQAQIMKALDRVKTQRSNLVSTS